MNDLVEGIKIEGNVIYEGKNIYSNNFDILELRRKIGMVFQTPNPFLMSIYDNISYGPKIHGTKDKKKLRWNSRTITKKICTLGRGQR